MKSTAPSILLCGYRGSGKTCVGRLLAAKLGRPFFDTDDMVVQGTGQSIKLIFQSSGESHFRDLETAALDMALVIPSAIVALGGGALGREENRKAIRAAEGQVVYLACAAEELHRRIQADVQTHANRPNLTGLGGGLEEVRELLSKRDPIYRSMATLTLDVTMCSAAEAADRIMASLKLAGPAEKA